MTGVRAWSRKFAAAAIVEAPPPAFAPPRLALEADKTTAAPPDSALSRRILNPDLKTASKISAAAVGTEEALTAQYIAVDNFAVAKRNTAIAAATEDAFPCEKFKPLRRPRPADTHCGAEDVHTNPKDSVSGSFQRLLGYPDLLDGSARKLSWAGNNTHFHGCSPLSTTSSNPLQQVRETLNLHSTCSLSSQICRGKKKSTNHSVLFQIQILLLSGKTLLQWVSSSDLVQDLKQALEHRLGIPYASQRLLYEGKQLEEPYPLSFYRINRNASIVFTLRLRGGAAGQSSTAPAFSYKDVVHAQTHKTTTPTPPAKAPTPFLVDKLEEIPSIEIAHPTLDEQIQRYAESAIICRFNGLWPRTADLYQWIHSNWTNNCKVLFCSKGFFVVVFAFSEDYQKAFTEGPWFWGTAGLFLTPWFPDFDPSTAVITKLPIWVRLPNLPAHLWHFAVFQGIGNTLGRFLAIDTSRGEKGIYTFGRICAEIDMSKGLPDQINLKIGDFIWTQTLDYENTAFRCRHCHQTGHLQSSCPSIPAQKKKVNQKKKSKSWKPCDPPPMDDIDSFSSDEEVGEVEEEETKQSQDPPMACLEESNVPPNSQKITHEYSPSDSDKETSPTAQINLQIVPAQPHHLGWVKVNKKKGKKCRMDDSTHAG